MGRALTKDWVKCSASGSRQMLDWLPSEDGSYPGAVVCLGCTFGVLVSKRSVESAVSQAGHEGLSGRVRMHWVKWERDPLQHRDEPVKLSYTKPTSNKKGGKRSVNV
jgi:hypothetical protein